MRSLLAMLAAVVSSPEEPAVERARLATVAVLPALVDGLTVDAVMVRRAAAGTLRAHSGQDMGFAPRGARTANAAAVARWRAWAGIK